MVLMGEVQDGNKRIRETNLTFVKKKSLQDLLENVLWGDNIKSQLCENHVSFHITSKTQSILKIERHTYVQYCDVLGLLCCFNI